MPPPAYVSGQCSFSAYAAFFFCCSGTRAVTVRDTVVETSRRNQQLIPPWSPPLPARSMSWYSARLLSSARRLPSAGGNGGRHARSLARRRNCIFGLRSEQLPPHDCSRAQSRCVFMRCSVRNSSQLWSGTDARWSVISLHHASPCHNPCACFLVRLCIFRR